MPKILRNLHLLIKFRKKNWFFVSQFILLSIIFSLSNRHTCHAINGILATIKETTVIPIDGIVNDKFRDNLYSDKTVWNYSEHYSESTNTTWRINSTYETVEFKITLSEDTQAKTNNSLEGWNLGKIFLNKTGFVNNSTALIYKLDKQVTNIIPIKMRRDGRVVITDVALFLASPTMTIYKFFVNVYRSGILSKNISPKIKRRKYKLLKIFWVRVSIDFCGSGLKISPVSSKNSATNNRIKLKPPLKGALNPKVDTVIDIGFNRKSFNFSLEEKTLACIDIADARALCGACDMSRIVYSLEVNDYFKVDGNNGIPRLCVISAEMLDYGKMFPNGKAPFVVLILRATLRKTAETTLNINIKEKNNNRPIFIKPYKAEIANDYPIKGEVIKAIAEDADQGNNGKIVYMLKDTDDLFDIDNETGKIFVLSSLIFDKRVSILVTAFAYDKGRPWKYSHTVVTIGLNHKTNQYPPVFSLNYYGTSCFEDIHSGAIIMQVRAYDPDYEDAPLDWRIFTNHNKRKVRHLPALWSSSRGNITDQKFGDKGSNSLNKHGIYNKKLKRGEPAPGPGNVASIFYSIVEGNGKDNDVFVIDSKLGDLKTNDKLDAETKSNYELTVQATDEGGRGLKTTVMVYIQVKDINDNPPEIIRPIQALGVSMDAKPGDLVYVVRAIDRDISSDPLNPVSFKENMPAPSFSFEPATGEIKVASSALQPGEETLTIEAQDRGVPPLSSTLSIPIRKYPSEAESPDISVYQNSVPGAFGGSGKIKNPMIWAIIVIIIVFLIIVMVVAGYVYHKKKKEKLAAGSTGIGKKSTKDSAKTPSLLAKEKAEKEKGGKDDKGKDDKGADKDKTKTATLKVASGLPPPPPGGDPVRPPGPDGKIPTGPPPPGAMLPPSGARPAGPPPPPGARPAGQPPPGAISGARPAGAGQPRPPMPPGTAPPLSPGGPPKPVDLSKPPPTSVPVTAKPPVFAGALPPLKDTTVAYTDDADKSYGYDYSYGYDTSQYGASDAYSADPYYNYNYGEYYDDYDSKYAYDDNYAYSYGGDDYNSDAYGYGTDPYYDYNYNDYYGGDYSDYYSGGDYGSYGGTDASATYGGEYSAYDSSAYGSGASAAYGSDAYASSAYGTDAYGTDAYGSTASGSDTYGSTAYGTDAYGSSAYGTDAYGSAAPGSDAYGGSAYGTDTYGSTVAGSDAYGSSAYGTEAGSTTYGTEGSTAYGTDAYGSTAYDASKGSESGATDQYASSTYEADLSTKSA
ncbi:unnamed protein product [Gordionus sp. m RMFG-2023]